MVGRLGPLVYVHPVSQVSLLQTTKCRVIVQIVSTLPHMSKFLICIQVSDDVQTQVHNVFSSNFYFVNVVKDVVQGAPAFSQVSNIPLFAQQVHLPKHQGMETLRW